jgi:hypothetical protein
MVSAVILHDPSAAGLADAFGRFHRPLSHAEAVEILGSICGWRCRGSLAYDGLRIAWDEPDHTGLTPVTISRPR